MGGTGTTGQQDQRLQANRQYCDICHRFHHCPIHPIEL
jgi:hypothetical protein